MYISAYAKNILRILVLAAIFLTFAVTTAFAAGDVILKLDGNVVETDVPPIIVEGRTLVPYRALLEAMGGTVYWEEKASMATAILGNRRVQITVNNNNGFVDGARKMLDVPPIIKEGRVLIPVRFVLENLGCNVEWDPVTRSVLIESPEKEAPGVITNIDYEEKDEFYRIIVNGVNESLNITSFSYDAPERFGVNIKEASFSQGVGSLKVNNKVMSGVRFSQFDKETVRIVVDLKEKIAGRLSFSEDGNFLFIDFDKKIVNDQSGQDPAKPEDPGQSEDPEQPDQPGNVADASALPELNWKAKGKLVVIDPGHGGKESGATGKVNGKTVLLERDLNLEIALILNDLLKQAGANVVMIRDRDVWIELYERPAIANKMKADLYISVHNNGYDGSELPNGVEVLYYDKVGIEKYGISSQQMAAFIQEELYPRTGLKDRGIKNSPHLAVLNKTLMPAVIIEGGFMSNPDDLAVILTSEYKQGYAMAAAIGIIKSLNYWVENEIAP